MQVGNFQLHLVSGSPSISSSEMKGMRNHNFGMIIDVITFTLDPFIRTMLH